MASGYASPPPQGHPEALRPHPYLTEPTLYVTNLPPYVTDENLAICFAPFAPFRLRISRDVPNLPLSGAVDFKQLEKAEQALTTLNAQPIQGLQPPVPLMLSPFSPASVPTPVPAPTAHPRLIKHLPGGYSPLQLYMLFRPFGPLASARTQPGFGSDIGYVDFWNEEDALQAEQTMHCADVEGSNIAVTVYQTRRVGGMSDFSPNAPAFVPTGTMSPYPVNYSPTRNPVPYEPRSPVFIHGPGQQVQLAPLSGPGSNSHSGLIDPCNLFCKNLDSEIDSNELFAHFRKFGQIVSARVMRNEQGESRGFGFVSFQHPEQATAAMNAMNGIVIRSKQLVVRLHEPKQLRQEKLAQRFAHGHGHPRSVSGATSPTHSDGGESLVGLSTPRHIASSLGPGSPSERAAERGRRGSTSYYAAALSGTSNIPMRYDDLAALSVPVRKEVLTGELSRRIRELAIVPNDELDAVVSSLVNLSLGDVVDGIQDTTRLTEQVKSARDSLQQKNSNSNSSKSPSPSASQDSALLDPNSLAAASAPEHPSTPISNGSLSSPPRTASPSGSVPPLSERDRMIAAVSRLESSRQAELTDLLMSLSKRERAMCLFNAEILRAKLADAKTILDLEEDEPEPAKSSTASSPPPAVAKPSKSAAEPPVTPQTKRTQPVAESPQTPDLSSRGPSAQASPMPTTPAAPSGHTLQSLARLPAAEIVRMATSPSATGLPLAKADPLVVKATDEFVDGLLDKPIQQQKQLLGDKLWRVIKSFGIKGAPKLTIALLDQDDLRSLAHLMNSYPSVLKEKALFIQSSMS